LAQWKAIESEHAVMTKVQSVIFPGPVGRLEGILKFNEKLPPRTLAVICHPHPLYQGTMHNKVVFAMAEAFYHLGCAVLRFNFRGVGMSTGSHDHGRGEVEDCLAAVQFLRCRYEATPCLIAGFSFGAWMAIETIGRDTSLISVTAAAPPIKYLQSGTLMKMLVPKLFLQGSADNTCLPEDLQELYPMMAGPKSLLMFEGAGHFFEGHFPQLKAAIAAHSSLLGLG
jgi:uncharacterized protein